MGKGAMTSRELLQMFLEILNAVDHPLVELESDDMIAAFQWAFKLQTISKNEKLMQKLMSEAEVRDRGQCRNFMVIFPGLFLERL